MITKLLNKIKVFAALALSSCVAGAASFQVSDLPSTNTMGVGDVFIIENDIGGGTWKTKQITLQEIADELGDGVLTNLTTVNTPITFTATPTFNATTIFGADVVPIANITYDLGSVSAQFAIGYFASMISTNYLFYEEDAAPANIAEGVRVYALDVGGVSKLYAKWSDGTEVGPLLGAGEFDTTQFSTSGDMVALINGLRSTNVAFWGTTNTFIGHVSFTSNAVVNGTLKLAKKSSATTANIGEMQLDEDGFGAGYGAIQLNAGTDTVFLIGVLSSDTPSDGQVPKWNTGGSITWEDDTGGGGSPGGSDREVQYNNSSSFDGASGITIPSGSETNLNVGGNFNAHSIVSTTSVEVLGSGAAGLLTLKDSDASDWFSFAVTNVVNTNTHLVLPDAPRTGLAYYILTDGTNLTWTFIEDGSEGEVLEIVSGVPAWGVDDTGAGSPSGSTGAFQYNDGGSYGGTLLSKLLWDDTNNIMAFGAPDLHSGVITIGGSAGGGASTRIVIGDGGGDTNYITSDGIGTFSASPLVFYVGNGIARNAKWEIESSTPGSLYPSSDVSTDLGTSTKNLRDIYVGRTIYVGEDSLASPGSIVMYESNGVSTLTIQPIADLNGSSVMNIGDVDTPTDGFVLAYEASSDSWIPVSNSAGSPSVAGADQNLQFNDGGVFGGVSNLLYDTSSGELQLTNIIGGGAPILRIRGDNSSDHLFINSSGIGTGEGDQLDIYAAVGSTRWIFDLGAAGVPLRPATDSAYNIGSPTVRVFTNFTDTVDTTDIFVRTGGGITYEDAPKAYEYIDAGAMIPATTDGASSTTFEGAGAADDKKESDYMAFAATGSNTVFFTMSLNDWDASTVKFKMHFSVTNSAAAQTNVFEFSAFSLGNGDSATNTAWGTAVVLTNAINANTNFAEILSSATLPITIGNTPSVGDILKFRIRRLPDHPDDTASDYTLVDGVDMEYGKSLTPLAGW